MSPEPIPVEAQADPAQAQPKAGENSILFDDPAQTLAWCSLTGQAPPKRIIPADDRIDADSAYRLVSQGTALLWQGDYHNARLLLQALGRRITRSQAKHQNNAKPGRAKKSKPPAVRALSAEDFHRDRQTRAQKARMLSLLLLPFEADAQIPLRRAPDVRAAWNAACAALPGTAFAAPLREVLGCIGAYEWRLKGIEIAPLGARIHAHYGVFAPLRSEYLELFAQAPLRNPPPRTAFDLGTGTGVLAAILLQRGVHSVVGTDHEPRALACARENLDRLGFGKRFKLPPADSAGLYPPGRADLVVCNPPWLPGRVSSPLDAAVYDPDSRMLRDFLTGLPAHLEPGGEGWLILSDLAEHLQLRSRETLLEWIEAAGLEVLGREEVAPRHPKAGDTEDPLHLARAAERTHLWRLAVRPSR